MDERRLELAFEGGDRHFDLVIWGLASGFTMHFRQKGYTNQGTPLYLPPIVCCLIHNWKLTTVMEQSPKTKDLQEQNNPVML